MRRLFTLLLSFALFGVQLLNSGTVSANENEKPADTAQLFLKANQAYKEGDFQKAVESYDKIISAGIINGQIFYNLGNAYLKSGKVGLAILNFRRSEIFMPRNEDLQTNLRFCLDLIRDKIECKEFFSFFKNFCFWYSKLNHNEMVAVFLIVNVILWAVLAVRIFYKGEVLAVIMYVVTFVNLVFGLSTGMKIYNLYFNYFGVVVAEEIMVRSGNSINDTVLFKLHEGAEFEWLQESAGWVKIRLCDEKKGWVQHDIVERIDLNFG